VPNKPSISDRLAGKQRSFVAAAIQPPARGGDQQDSAEHQPAVQDSQKPTNPVAPKLRSKPPRDRVSASRPKAAKPVADEPVLPQVKATFAIRPDQITTLEEIRLEVRKRGEKPPSKNDLAQEAIDLLATKHGFK